MGVGSGIDITAERTEALPDISLSLLRANDAKAWQIAQRVLWERMWRAVHRKMPLATESQLTVLVSEILCDPVVAQLFEPESDAFRSLHTFVDLVNLACHIAGLRAIDKIRQSVRRGTSASLDAVPEGLLAGDSSEREKDQAEAVQFALSQVDDRYLDPLVLHYFEGLGTQEITDRLAIPRFRKARCARCRAAGGKRSAKGSKAMASLSTLPPPRHESVAHGLLRETAAEAPLSQNGPLAPMPDALLLRLGGIRHVGDQAAQKNTVPAPAPRPRSVARWGFFLSLALGATADLKAHIVPVL